jgi:corrinoid protein of di/trimethylamine methyltransferase
MSNEILEGLKRAVLEYDVVGSKLWAQKAVEQGVEPLAALQALTEAIRDVGEGFGRGDLWLPDLVGASEAMLAAMPTIEAEIARKGAERKSLGRVVIGTVYGDLHNIGKAMVATLLTAEGFEVYDLGINVQAQQFVAAVQTYDADLLAMSALMTTTIAEQRRVIEQLQEAGIRDKVKVMVGGGGVTQDFAEQIGADGYDPTAPGAVKLAREMLAL